MNEDQYRTERGGYTAEDFLVWNEKGTLNITPKFQRRGVWNRSAKAFFIDTLLRGMTVPPIYLRMGEDAQRTKLIREVVDGQQRLRAILEFFDDGFKLHHAKGTIAPTPWAGKVFSQLSKDEQRRIKTFYFTVETFRGISDKQILEVFCRLNMNGIGLNAQELRNGRFYGHFKNVSYDIALSHLQFWRSHNIFTEIGIARMLEVELTSELLIAARSGMQDKKKSVDEFYKLWDEEFPDAKVESRKFDETLAAISDTFDMDDLSRTGFKRGPLFYTLYCVVFHRMFGLPNITRKTPKKPLTSDQRGSLRDATLLLSEKMQDIKDPDIEVPSRYMPFIVACQRQTDNIQPRKTRFDGLYDEAF